MVPTVSFVGKSGSGKTTLLEKVVRELKLKGYRVAVVKHAPHGFDIDQPGKDTWRLAQAGSELVAISSPNRVALIERVDAEPTLTQLEAFFQGKADIVLAEGYKASNTPKILVLNSERDHVPLCYEGEILATVSARSSTWGAPQFDANDVTRITNLLMERITANHSRNLGGVSQRADLISTLPGIDKGASSS